jgi:hypothetical protein
MNEKLRSIGLFFLGYLEVDYGEKTTWLFINTKTQSNWVVFDSTEQDTELFLERILIEAKNMEEYG